MTPWDDHVACLREKFIDGLVQRGMRLTLEESNGAESKATLVNQEVTVELSDGFPYLPPKVTTNLDVPKTWHQERNGGLCLYTSRDRDQQPWLDPDAFLARIAQWFEKNNRGWPDDPPALDLEAYLGLPLDPRFVVYGELDQLADDFVKLRGDGRLLRVVGSGKAPKKSTREISGYVADLGALTKPPRDWEALISSLDRSGQIREAIRCGRVDVLLIQYSRFAQRGVLALTFDTAATGRQPRIAFSGGADVSSMALRAGPAAVALSNKHVYVIGAGALGSHMCDGLSRAGIGRLTIRDADYLTPGNMTRHLVTDVTQCGVSKAMAVKAVLANRLYNRAEIADINEGLRSPKEAAAIFEQCDLVVDATADGAVTAMLEDAARINKHRFITACLQNDGRTQRVDVVPPHGAASALPPVKLIPQSGPEVYEGGCGEPVSPTPPYAVAEAAAMTVRHIIGQLTGRPPTPSGEVRQTP